MVVMPALGRLRQVDGKFKANTGQRARSCLNQCRGQLEDRSKMAGQEAQGLVLPQKNCLNSSVWSKDTFMRTIICIISPLRRLRQVDCCKCQDSSGCRVRNKKGKGITTPRQ